MARRRIFHDQRRYGTKRPMIGPSGESSFSSLQVLGKKVSAKQQALGKWQCSSDSLRPAIKPRYPSIVCWTGPRSLRSFQLALSPSSQSSPYTFSSCSPIHDAVIKGHRRCVVWSHATAVQMRATTGSLLGQCGISRSLFTKTHLQIVEETYHSPP